MFIANYVPKCQMSWFTWTYFLSSHVNFIFKLPLNTKLAKALIVSLCYSAIGGSAGLRIPPLTQGALEDYVPLVCELLEGKVCTRLWISTFQMVVEN